MGSRSSEGGRQGLEHDDARAFAAHVSRGGRVEGPHASVRRTEAGLGQVDRAQRGRDEIRAAGQGHRRIRRCGCSGRPGGRRPRRRSRRCPRPCSALAGRRRTTSGWPPGRATCPPRHGRRSAATSVESMMPYSLTEMPTKAPVFVPRSDEGGRPASSKASQLNSSKSRCCGSIRNASRSEMPKKWLSKSSMLVEIPAPPRAHLAGSGRIGVVEALDVPAVGRRFANGIHARRRATASRTADRRPRRENGRPCPRSRSARPVCAPGRPAAPGSPSARPRRVAAASCSSGVRPVGPSGAVPGGVLSYLTLEIFHS